MMTEALKRILILICIVLVPLGVTSNVVVDASCDSTMMWIGEQSKIHISVVCDAGQNISFPVFNDTIVDKLEIVPPIETDTQYIDHKKRMSVTRSYTVTSFDSAFFYIPPFQVTVDGAPYQSANGLSLAVYMFEVDTLNTDQFFGPKDIMAQPIKWQDVKPATLNFILLALLLALAVFLFIRLKNDKPIIKTIRIEPKKPAHEVAFAEMERIRQSKLPHGEDAKQYYTELTDAIRLYMNERFGFNATEMTSDEIIENLMSVRDKESLIELRELFMTSDLVKFAKFKPMLGDNDRNLLTAIEFVKDTMSQEESAATEPQEEIVVERKRSKEARILLTAAIIVLTAASCYLLFLLCRQIYYLFF